MSKRLKAVTKLLVKSRKSDQVLSLNYKALVSVLEEQVTVFEETKNVERFVCFMRRTVGVLKEFGERI